MTELFNPEGYLKLLEDIQRLSKDSNATLWSERKSPSEVLELMEAAVQDTPS